MKTMRVSNKCYSRELRSLELGRRMLRLGGRTQTICAWTGLTGDRVRGLIEALGQEGTVRCAARQRGPSPSKFAAVMASPSLRDEAPAIAGICRHYDVIPRERCQGARQRLPELARGERLCDALELFQRVVPDTRITLEQVVLLVFTLAEEGESWGLDFCAGCHALILTDRLALSRRLCKYCGPATDGGEPASNYQPEKAASSHKQPPASQREDSKDAAVKRQEPRASDPNRQHPPEGHVKRRGGGAFKDERSQHEEQGKASE
jgi:hypothetical protein